ncbi:MAG: ABC transporter [Acidimicrobiales bacterium]|nr:MAG: ABC transporter [Acidimicrobiales bacterium]
MLRTSSLSIRRGQHCVLHELSLRVREGGWLAVVGRNGAGKSTLLAALAGLLPYNGEIELDGVDVSTLPRRKRAQRIAYLPQTPIVPEQLGVADYVLLGRVPHAGYFGRSSSADQRIATDVLRRLELRHFADRPLGTLSGGERQRAMLARALAGRAPLFLADEPTSALDLGHQQQVLELLDQLRSSDGLTVITAMHDLTLAAQYAEQVALLDAGRLAAVGRPRDVLTESALAQHYGVQVDVTLDINSRPVITPRRSK